MNLVVLSALDRNELQSQVPFPGSCPSWLCLILFDTSFFILADFIY